MKLLQDFGPLIESGEIDGATYEVRGATHPMVYVYRQARDSLTGRATQLGSTPLEVVVRMLAAELPGA